MKKLRVTVDGRAFEIQVEIQDPIAAPTATPATAPAAAASASLATSAPSGAGTVVSPLAGKIVSIDVKVGQIVAGGAQVATIEAMKMNTFVYAAKAGTVSIVHANPGDTVEEGAALLTIA